jgi:hypothetical protein
VVVVELLPMALMEAEQLAVMVEQEQHLLLLVHQ